MKKLVLAAAVMMAAICGRAEQSGLQIALVPEVALRPMDTYIHGLAVNLVCGQNQHSGLSLGFINGSTDESSGFSWGGLLNYGQSYKGLQLAMINVVTDGLNGCQFGAVNYAGGVSTGAQLGFLNMATDIKGLQFGGFNYTDRLQGVQIGFINVAAESPWFSDWSNKVAPAFPFLNWAF